MPFAMYI